MNLTAKPHIVTRDGNTVIEYRVPSVKAAQSLYPVWNSTFLGVCQEPYAGAWQRNVTGTAPRNVLAFSAVYACVSLIAGDISKLRLMVTELQGNGTWREVTDPRSPLLPVLRKPNAYQTRVQFVDDWITSKLLHGNTYVLLERDNREVVVAMYVLNPHCVTPMVAENGDVFYKLRRDNLAGIGEDGDIVPASEMIHDRMSCFWHPLIGVSPIFACGLSAVQGVSIQENASQFFKNMSRPSGVLTSPNKISTETADRVKKLWEDNFGSSNIGRLAVMGDGLHYEAMTIPPVEAQMIEQLRWTVEDVARCFHVPPYKLGLQTNVTFSNAGQLDQDYYSQCIHKLLEAFELLIDEALSLPKDSRRSEFDTEGLLRMDPIAQADTSAKLIGAAIQAPDEARLKFNLPPVEGGRSPYLQQQNYSLAALAKRDAREDPFASANTTPTSPAKGEELSDDELLVIGKSADEFLKAEFAC